jgi:hypothetical protein
VLSQDHGGTPEEWEALVNALNGLRVLRMDPELVPPLRSFDAGVTLIAKNIAAQLGCDTQLSSVLMIIGPPDALDHALRMPFGLAPFLGMKKQLVIAVCSRLPHG